MTKPPRSWLIRDDSNQHNVRLTATPVNGTGGWSDYEVPREGIRVVPASALAAAEAEVARIKTLNAGAVQLATLLEQERDEALAENAKLKEEIEALKNGK